mgnify:CR=1 FL=1
MYTNMRSNDQVSVPFEILLDMEDEPFSSAPAASSVVGPPATRVAKVVKQRLVSGCHSVGVTHLFLKGVSEP